MLAWRNPDWYSPTASQKPDVGQDTPSRVGATVGVVSPVGFGVGCRCQVVPSHLSAKVTLIPEGLRLVPTAVHVVGSEQEIDSIFPPDSVTFGDCAIVQAGLAACAPIALPPTMRMTNDATAIPPLLIRLATVKSLRLLIGLPFCVQFVTKRPSCFVEPQG
jgi:hypothetical protein